MFHGRVFIEWKKKRQSRFANRFQGRSKSYTVVIFHKNSIRPWSTDSSTAERLWSVLFCLFFFVVGFFLCSAFHGFTRDVQWKRAALNFVYGRPFFARLPTSLSRCRVVALHSNPFFFTISYLPPSHSFSHTFLFFFGGGGGSVSRLLTSGTSEIGSTDPFFCSSHASQNPVKPSKTQ